MEIKEPVLYGLSYSQEIIDLQTKYALFKRVVNILFSLTFEDGFDHERMREAISLLYKRNDCLRLRFVKDGKQTKEYFQPEVTPGSIATVDFPTVSSMESYLRRFRKKGLNMFKGECLQVVFAKNPSGKQMVLCKINHFVADTYGIGVLVADLCGIYEALKNGTELPPAPGRFEDIIRKDNEYRTNEEQVQKDREFFQKYYGTRHADRPVYCGIHGEKSDRWMKQKNKGNISMPYFLLRCDTTGYQFVIPASVSEKVEKWCSEKEIPLGTFYYYACTLSASLLNGKVAHPVSLELINCRGTIADRKAAGTKVQSLAFCNTVDYNRTFLDNVKGLYEEQNELYRHTRLSYLELDDLQHKVWKYSMLSSMNGFSFSFIPMAMPKGISFQVYSNGKGALVAYIALVMDPESKEIAVTYDVQDLMITPEVLIEFQNKYVQVIEAVIAHDEETLNQIFA